MAMPVNCIRDPGSNLFPDDRLTVDGEKWSLKSESHRRIFAFRCLNTNDLVDHHYELMEIPKAIFVAACSAGDFTLMTALGQTPKPGYCRVSDAAGLMYELYFDGGTGRKLRGQKLRRNLCTFHAEWKFATPPPTPS